MEVPEKGAKVEFDAADLNKNLDKKKGEFKPAANDWVPPRLVISMFAAAKRMQAEGTTFELFPTSGARPAMINCKLKDGTKLTGKFVLRQGQVAEVVVEGVAKR